MAAVLLTAGIAGISLFFHYPVHIADALTLEVQQQYDVAISIERIIFEPVLGTLLFFNRALYPLREFVVVLYWVIGVFVLYSTFRFFRLAELPARKRYALRQLADMPILVGLWFALLVTILFLPLPSNTIINNDERSVLVNTHAHTEYSHDGLMSQKALWDWHDRNGFDAFFITDHNNHDRTLDFVREQRTGKFSARPLVMCGEEFSGSNHLSLLGLQRKFSTRGYADSTAIDSVRANGGAVIVNHWFDDEHMSLVYYRDLGVDGFEIENSAMDRLYNRQLFQTIRDFCVRNGLLMNGGVDFHGYGNACSLWNAFDLPGWRSLDQEKQEFAILEILRDRDQDRLTVLKYRDRPYYRDEMLWISPLRTLLYYFRTLQWFQVISWSAWLLAGAMLFWFLRQKRGDRPWHMLFPLLGVAGALFLVVLGLVFLVRHQPVEGFTELYAEYSRLLLSVGGAIFVYSAAVALVRFRGHHRFD